MNYSENCALSYKIIEHDVYSYMPSLDLTTLESLYIPQATPSGYKMTLVQANPSRVHTEAIQYA